MKPELKVGDLAYVWTRNAIPADIVKKPDGLRVHTHFYPNATTGRPAGQEDFTDGSAHPSIANLTKMGLVGIYVPKPADGPA